MRSLLVATVASLALPGLPIPRPACGCSETGSGYPEFSKESFELTTGGEKSASGLAPGAPVPIVFTREFVEPLVIANGHKPKALLDVDLDGDLDVVARSGGLVFFENPSWTPYEIASNGTGEDARAADIDGDGDFDICYSGKTDNPDCAINPLAQGMDPRTTEWAVVEVGVVPGDGGHDIELVDIDQDGRIDLIHLFGIFFQDPVGTWNPVDNAVILPDRGFKGTSFGDIDGDGDIDLVTPGVSEPYQLIWHENPLPLGDPRVDPWTSRPIGPSPEAMTSQVADLSGDGVPDVIASPLSEPPTAANGLVWHEAPADPTAPGATWTERSIDPTVGFVHQGSIHAEDMNGDGIRDVVIVEQEQSSSDRLAIYYNHGGGLAWTEHVLTNVGGHNSKLGDIDGDGDIDILNANHGHFGEPNPIEIFRNTSVTDTTAPAISGLEVQVGEREAFLVFATDEPTSVRVEVSTGGLPPRVLQRDSYRELHGIPIDDLACATSYDLVLEVRDAAGFVTASAPTPIVTAACGSGTGPVSAGLVALYEFDESGGTTVGDSSGVGTPLDLTIQSPGAVTWLPDGLRLDAPGGIVSGGAATKLIDAAETSGEITIDAWIDPESDQTQDAAIVALGNPLTSSANLRLEQPTYAGDMILRLTLLTPTSEAGSRGFEGPYFASTTQLTHLVYSHGADGLSRLYLNGVLVEINDTRHPDAISGWDPAAVLQLGDRATGGFEWLGTYHRLAVYGRELSGDEVRRNYVAGPGPSACEDGVDNDGDGAIDFGSDAGCVSAADDSERELGRPCDDALDGDADGVVDFPADIGCEDADAPDENAAPVVSDDVYRMLPGGSVSESAPTGVLANDFDSEGDALDATLLDGVGAGTFAFFSDGGFDFTPDPAFEGIDGFTYTASDGFETSGTANVTLVVAPADAPAALGESYQLDPGTTLVVDAASGLLANDDDPQGIETVTPEVQSGPFHGVLDLSPDGSFEYVPHAGFVGNDVFAYRGNDGTQLSNLAEVQLRVAPFPSPPVAHWRFDEGSGATASDSTGNGNDGTLATPAWSSASPFGTGGSLDFDGDDDHVALGPLDLPGNALTLMTFLSPDSFSVGDARLISKAQGTAESDHVWMLGLQNSGGDRRLRFRLTAGGSSTTLVADSGTLETGVWSHAAAVYDGSSVRLYLDGEQVGVQSKSGAIAPSAVDAAIGNQPPGAGSRGFDGLLDGVRIYDTALSEEAIRAIIDGLGAPFTLAGTAEGGTILLLVEDVEISVTTVPGQSAAQVAAALANAINQDAGLAALGIVAHAEGGSLITNGVVDVENVGDPGFVPPVPGLGVVGSVVLTACLALGAARRRRAA